MNITNSEQHPDKTQYVDQLLNQSITNTGQTELRKIISDKLLITGWILTLISFIIFCIPLMIQDKQETEFEFFIFHFAAVIVYTGILWGSAKKKIQEHRVHYQLIKLILLLISAYALNREFEVFATSPQWFCILLVSVCVNYLASPFFNLFSSFIKVAHAFIQGVALILFIYLAVYLIPLYLLSLFALIALGLSIHGFVPVLFIYQACRLIGLQMGKGLFWKSFVSGITATILIVIIFSFTWNRTVNKINQEYSNAMIEGDDELPLWVQLSQKLDRTIITEEILKTDFIYKTPDFMMGSLWQVPVKNFGGERQTHDPLIMVGSFFSKKILISEQDRIKILESQYNSRHQALNRIWNGDHLKTEQITNNIRIWPELHLAYTEKFISIYNHEKASAWGSQEEAIYTFHLPEGGVVTSLSLWINGKEERGILTTKGKADSAYTTTVGIERRDPSVIHWQEGNTASVRVFPVLAGSTRTFKIGITAPLRKENDQLVYDNIWFEGPDAASCDEKIKLEMASAPQTFLDQSSFDPANGNSFIKSGDNKPRWSLHFTDPGLSTSSFSFGGYHYKIIPYQKESVATNITDVYLDINRFWTNEELKSVWELVRNKRVWVFEGAWLKLDEKNYGGIVKRLSEQQFSLFPFHLVGDKEHALIVSKSGDYSPNISDLEGSSFLKSMKEKSDPLKKIKLFNLGGELCPYIRSLKEFRLFDFESGDVAGLKHIINANQFVIDNETANSVNVQSAQITITKESGELNEHAPDHLMRLFAYNHIMKELGSATLTGKSEDSAVIEEARQAYVVSPVSSLLVLEKLEDYDRFNIKDADKSLKNASLKSKGAVPEPAEWAMIILAGCVFIFFLLKWKFI